MELAEFPQEAALLPQEIFDLPFFDATEHPGLEDVYYEFVFSLYLGLTRQQSRLLDEELHFLETPDGIFFSTPAPEGTVGTHQVNLYKIAEGAPATLYQLYKGRYQQPFFGPLTSRVYDVKLRELLKVMGIERKLTVDDDFARRSAIVFYRELGLDASEILKIIGQFEAAVPEPI